jgi:hypothetical protein
MNDMATLRGKPLLAQPDLDGLARQFLHSQYADAAYMQWPLDRRLESFLQYRGLTRVADDGDLYNVVLDRVMTHISKATVHPNQKR